MIVMGYEIECCPFAKFCPRIDPGTRMVGTTNFRSEPFPWFGSNFKPLVTNYILCYVVVNNDIY